MILIVDDHRDTATALARLLSQSGHDAIAVDSAPAALSLLQRTRPDVMVLDNHMPQMSGLDLMHAIRDDAHMRDIPVIFYSADSNPNEVERALQLGAKDYLVKASTPWAEVCETVERYAVA